MRIIRNQRGEVAAEITAQTKWVQAVSLKLASVADAVAFQEAIDLELVASKTRRVLVDARQAELSTKAMNESMWSWVRSTPHFDRLAIVNQSPAISVAARMKAKSIGTKKVTVVHQFQQAAHWLMGADDD